MNSSMSKTISKNQLLMAMVEAYIGEGVSMNSERMSFPPRKVGDQANRHARERMATFTMLTAKSGVLWKAGC